MDIKLREMQVGETGEIIGYKKENTEYRAKLLSMGLTKGSTITVTKHAPLGDPVEIELRGYKLSLRKAEAEILILRRR